MVGLIMPTTPRQEENAMSQTFRDESRAKMHEGCPPRAQLELRQTRFYARPQQQFKSKHIRAGQGG
jgi:hypothetical protein